MTHEIYIFSTSPLMKYTFVFTAFDEISHIHNKDLKYPLYILQAPCQLGFVSSRRVKKKGVMDLFPT